MKKTALALMCGIGFCYGGFDENFTKAIKDFAKIDTEVVSKHKLKSFDGNYFVVAKTKEGKSFPAIASSDGKYFIGLSPAMALGEADMKKIQKEIESLQNESKKEQAKGLKALFSSFKESDFIYLKGEKKNAPVKIVVTDPDCPYCRAHLENVEEVLKENDIKLILAPLPSHGKDAEIKSQLAMNEVAKLGKNDTKGKLKVLRKYYKDINLSAKEKAINTNQVSKNKDKIFDSGLINGVPFYFDEK